MRLLILPLYLVFFLAACASSEPQPPTYVTPEQSASTITGSTETVIQPTDTPTPASIQQTAPAMPMLSESPSTAKEYYVDPNNFNIHPVEQESNTPKIVLLTFDDGPKGKVTHQILDILDKYQAKSIWFINGFNYGWEYQAHPEKAEDFKAYVKEIHNRGHLIANHTWEHENLRKLPPDKQIKEILSMNELLTSITGEKVKYFRPPFGAYTDVQKQLMKEQDMQWMNWSVGSLDWEHTDPQKVVDQVLSTVHNGANILMHDLPVTAEALDPILKQLSEMGYTFVLPTQVRTD